MGNNNDPEYFNLGNMLDEDEQRELSQAAELCAALCALELDEPEEPPSSSANGDTDELPATSCIDSIKVVQDFIKEVQAATLDNGNLDNNLVYCLHNPPEQPADISDPNVWLSLDLFLAATNASKETYKVRHDAILRRYPESGVLSYYAVKKRVAEISGVVAVYDNMCINSCHAFTGPFSQLLSRFPLALSHKMRPTRSCTRCGSMHVTLGINTQQTLSMYGMIRTMKTTAWRLGALSSPDWRA
jgi:hypothetical protein